jgi:hypothetical protein
MKQEVTLTEQEVNQALLDYAAKHGVRFEGMSATVTVVAGRGERGVYATIALEPQKDVNTGIEKIWNTTPTSFDSSLITQAELDEINSLDDEGVPIDATQEIDEDTEVFG